MQYVQKGKGTAVGIIVAVTLFAAALMASPEGGDTLRPMSSEKGMIQLALVTPVGVDYIAKKEEACTATVHVFDTLGYNEATVPLDICCQPDTQHCGICSFGQPPVTAEQADLQLSSQVTARETPVILGCLDTANGAAQVDAPVAAGSKANANGMCRI